MILGPPVTLSSQTLAISQSVDSHCHCPDILTQVVEVLDLLLLE